MKTILGFLVTALLVLLLPVHLQFAFMIFLLALLSSALLLTPPGLGIQFGIGPRLGPPLVIARRRVEFRALPLIVVGEQLDGVAVFLRSLPVLFVLSFVAAWAAYFHDGWPQPLSGSAGSAALEVSPLRPSLRAPHPALESTRVSSIAGAVTVSLEQIHASRFDRLTRSGWRIAPALLIDRESLRIVGARLGCPFVSEAIVKGAPARIETSRSVLLDDHRMSLDRVLECAQTAPVFLMQRGGAVVALQAAVGSMLTALPWPPPDGVELGVWLEGSNSPAWATVKKVAWVEFRLIWIYLLPFTLAALASRLFGIDSAPLVGLFFIGLVILRLLLKGAWSPLREQVFWWLVTHLPHGNLLYETVL